MTKQTIASVAAVALLAGGCSTATEGQRDSVTATAPSATSAHPNPTAATSPPSPQASAAPGTVSKDLPCGNATYTPAQFIGDWVQDGGSGDVRTLGADDKFTDRHGEEVTMTGSWGYIPWEFTPAGSTMPESAAGTCVLWLHTNAVVTDFVYVPLKLTPDSLELSYVGRGNTLIWKRSGTTS